MKERVRASAIFLLIGVLLLVVAYLLRPTSSHADSFISTTLSNIAFVLLTVTILNFLWSLLGGDPVSNTLDDLRKSFRSFDDNLKQSFSLFDNNMQRYINLLGDSRITGVIRLLSVSGDFGSHGDWTRRLEAVQKQVDLMGYTLYVWTKGENFEEKILKLVQEGKKVRILIMDEQNPFLESFINMYQISGTSTTYVRAELQEVQKAFKDISTKVQNMKLVNPSGSFEVRLVQRGLIVCQICRTDSEMVVVNYLYSEVGSRSPLMLIQGNESKMFQAYQKEFDQLWKLNEPIPISSNQSNTLP